MKKTLTNNLKAVVFWLYIFIVIILLKEYVDNKQFNPEIHVCEEWDLTSEYDTSNRIFITKEVIKNNPSWFDCKSFRDKTSQEQDIKDCNDNPREDKDCFCEGYSEEIISCGGYPTVKTLNFRSQEELEDYVFESRFGDRNICSFYPSEVKYYLKIKDYIKEFDKEEKRYMDEYGLNYTIINIIVTDNYAPKEFRDCIKAKPR